MVRIKAIIGNIYWYFRSLFWHRDRSIVLFGSWFGNRFADTSRFLFQYLSDNKTKLNLKEVVWVCRDESLIREASELGLKIYYMDSKESLYYHKHAGIHILCNYCNDLSDKNNDLLCRYSFGAKKINLWHGVMSMKGVACASNEYKEYKNSHPLISSLKEFFTLNSVIYRTIILGIGGWGDAYYLSTTPAGTDDLNRFFILPRNHFIETTNPRIAFKAKLIEREQLVINIRSSYKKTILYLPTFRGVGSYFRVDELSSILTDVLQKNNYLLLQKYHLASKEVDLSGRLTSNSMVISPDIDINVLLPYIDLVITDYSSVAADAVFFNIPVVYYMPDYEEYMKHDRGFLVNPKDIACGPITYTPEELLESVDSILNGSGNHIDKELYEGIKEKYWGKTKTMDEVWFDITSAIKVK